jgi:hypothetical protein
MALCRSFPFASFWSMAFVPSFWGEGGGEQDIPSHVIGEDVNIPREPHGPFLPELGESSGPSLLLNQAGRLIH